MKKLAPLLLIGLIYSCRFHSGTFHSNGTACKQPSRNAGAVSGTASTDYFLGIGGFGTFTLIDDARQNIYERYPFPPNVILENITINQTKSFLFIGMSHRVTVTADLIDLNPITAAQLYMGFYTVDSIFFPLSKFPYDYSENRLLSEFNIGDKVTFLLNGKSENATILQRNSYGYICMHGNDKKIYLQKGQMQLISK